MLPQICLAMLCVVVGVVSAAVYGEHEQKTEHDSYLLYDVSVKHGKGDLTQAFELLSELHLGQAYKLVGEARALFQVADRHTCPDHTVDIPDAHVRVEIARSLESLVADFNITLNMTDDASHMDNKYLTLIEVTYDDGSDTSEALKNIVDGFVAVHNSTDCDHCIIGYYIIGARPVKVVYIANVKPKDVMELYDTLGLNGGNVTAEAHRLVNFHSYLEGKATHCDVKDIAHAAVNSGVGYIKPVLGYSHNVHNGLAPADHKQGADYNAKKGIPVYGINSHHTPSNRLPQYSIGNGNFNYKPLGGKHPGFAIPKPLGYDSGKPAGYDASEKTADHSDGKEHDDTHTEDDSDKKTGSDVKPPTAYQAQQDRFYSNYNIPKHGGFITPNNFNLESKDHLFVF